MTLKQARQARDDARRLHQAGTDPAQRRQLDKLAREAQRGSGFEAVAREFHAAKADSLSPRYSARWLERMEKDLFPWIGSLPLADISAPLLLMTPRRVEARGAKETAHTLHQTAGRIFRYGIATGRCERRPCARFARRAQAHSCQTHGRSAGTRQGWRPDPLHRQLRRPAHHAIGVDAGGLAVGGAASFKLLTWRNPTSASEVRNAP